MLCPICKKSVYQPNENDPGDHAGPSYFPFCSERCKLIDLGRWLGGKYQIPVRSDDGSEHPAAPRPSDD